MKLVWSARTLILVNAAGIVMKPWLGTLSEERQRQLLSIISGHGPANPLPQPARPN